MAIPRKILVDTENPGFYHCTNRCVRRAFLCGIDEVTGQNYEHRKAWLECRIVELCKIFAVDIYAFAIMNNHYHLVLYVDPKAPLSWSKEQVAERWLKAFPGSLELPKNSARRALKKLSIMADDAKIASYRQRLGNLSWFMARLNEPLAKKSNAEDDCTGKFWEERYSSQALLDEGAIFSCMAYVDLNPIRAKIASTLENSHHTSIKQRLKLISSRKESKELDSSIKSVIGQLNGNKLTISLREYIQLVEWTGRSLIYPDRGFIPKNIPPIFDKFNLQQHHWLNQIGTFGSKYCHVIGTMAAIRLKAEQMQRRCLHGVFAASQLYQQNN